MLLGRGDREASPTIQHTSVALANRRGLSAIRGPRIRREIRLTKNSRPVASLGQGEPLGFHPVLGHSAKNPLGPTQHDQSSVTVTAGEGTAASVPNVTSQHHQSREQSDS